MDRNGLYYCAWKTAIQIKNIIGIFMPIFIAKKITLNYAKRMRERILILSILLSLPIYAYGSITVNCPETNNRDICMQVPGCYFRSTGYDTECARCGEGSYCPGDGNVKECDTETNGSFEYSPNGSTSQNDCYKKIDNTNNYCEKQDGSHIQTCGLFYPNSTPKCWDTNTGEYDTAYHIESNNKCYSNIRNCKLFNNSDCDGVVSGSLKWTKNENEWYTTGQYNCECEKTGIQYNSCIADVTYSLTGIAPDNDTEQATITFGDAPSSYKCTKCPAGKYLVQSDFTSNSQCAGNTVACSCTDVEQGFYSTECTIRGTSSCQQTPCPKPGQTTNGAGAGKSEQDCHYSSETKFCDATGCFRIPDAGYDNVWHWTY